MSGVEMLELELRIDSKAFIVVVGLDVAVVVCTFGVFTIIGDDVGMFESEETVDVTEDEAVEVMLSILANSVEDMVL